MRVGSPIAMARVRCSAENAAARTRSFIAKPTAAEKTSEQTFETAIERLESIVHEMESDKLPLEDLLLRYEEGTKLVKVCESKLQSAEKRIEIIARNASGEAQLEEFEPEKKVVPPAQREEVSLF